MPSSAWICAVCIEPKDERPAYERQLLFPGCGSVCGHQVRICVGCKPEVEKLSAEQIAELVEREHQRHHLTTPPIKGHPVHIKPLEKKP